MDVCLSRSLKIEKGGSNLYKKNIFKEAKKLWNRKPTFSIEINKLFTKTRDKSDRRDLRDKKLTTASGLEKVHNRENKLR